MKQRLQIAGVVCLVVFAVLLIADRVMAGITFLPLVTGGSAQTGNPTHVLSVFSSATTTTGNAGGRTGLNQICIAADPASHACTLYEIESAMKTSGVYFKNPFSTSWVDTPAVLGTDIVSPQSLRITGSSDWGSLSCDSFTTSNPSEYGTLINPQAADVTWGDSHNVLYDNACSIAHAVACCKWMP